jgi:hypothetical protein
MSNSPVRRVGRRAFLRGIGGAALALPMLEIFGAKRADAAPGDGPRRVIFVFSPNGDEIDRRFTNQDPTNFVFDEFLAPLEPYRSDLLLLNGVSKKFGELNDGEKADNHQQGGSSLAPWPSGAGSFPIGGTDDLIGYVEGPSVDYALGDRVMETAPVTYRHLVYRVGGNDNNIWNLHSHAGPIGTQNPVPPETDPWESYSKLFSFLDPTVNAEIQARLARRQSALDLVREETKFLATRLGKNDKLRLEQHTDALNDIEHILQASAGGLSCGPFDPGGALDPYEDDNHEVAGLLFFKISAMAFACDLTRVINFNWHGNTSNRVYKNLGMTEGHHDISHEGTPDSFVKIRQIKKHLWTLTTKLYDELKALPEGDTGGSVWDNTLVVHWDELGQGDSHTTNSNLVILAGGNAGYFQRGRLNNYDNDVGFASILVSCFHYMGFTDVTEFGDTRLNDGGPLAGITA